jgi:hypothetical protein
MLVEILGVLVMVAASGGLITAGILSVRYAQQRIADSANRTALTDDFIRCLSRDVRRASTARVRDPDAEDVRVVLEVGGASDQVTYRFFENRVERAASPDGTVAQKLWEPMTATVSVVGEDTAQMDVVVSATVFWHKTKKDDPRSNRRFDVAVRCAGERSYDVD